LQDHPRGSFHVYFDFPWTFYLFIPARPKFVIKVKVKSFPNDLYCAVENRAARRLQRKLARLKSRRLERKTTLRSQIPISFPFGNNFGLVRGKTSKAAIFDMSYVWTAFFSL